MQACLWLCVSVCIYWAGYIGALHVRASGRHYMCAGAVSTASVAAERDGNVWSAWRTVYGALRR